MRDTIFALATAAGRAAVAVIRLSGPDASTALTALAGKLPEPRLVTLRTLRHPVSRETLDQALILWMPGPSSFTGEDVVELHLHGGSAVVAAVSTALANLGLRAAEPGEFSRRAFENGRLDLTQAEAIADLVDAQSAAQRQQALAQLDGSTAREVETWRANLIQALAFLEAAIDFPDEDIPTLVAERAAKPLQNLHDAIEGAVLDLRGERIRDGYRVALIGAPNAGKSSLLNRLIGRDAAIVTEVAGTTRDVIEQPLEIAGYRLLLADTAGLRETDERIEAEGVRRARTWAASADLRLWVVDGADAVWRDSLEVVRQGDILVLNKSDLELGAPNAEILDASDLMELEPVEASALTEEGLIELRLALERRVVRDLAGAEPATITRLRHRRLLVEAQRHLARALTADGADPELMAEDVRLAARALEALTGRVDAESVLTEIFSSFCIGK
ncbi:MAG: tRNA uridine-5-carboxymethylaminomethyl(34) synthesis GTPase MnmE [Pseudomonadota bacterium]|nr:tRNA uridine-5-carboxymethylaminomethyl(34) synthesis GTPase MnmE [Pseudomonadota bacterium]